MLQELEQIAQIVEQRLEQYETRGHTLTLKVKLSDYHQITRRKTMLAPISKLSTGYAICINYLHNQQAAQAIVSSIAKMGGRLIAVAADVALEEDVIKLFQVVDEQLGKVTALVKIIRRSTLVLPEGG
ncbi:hypothetical protein A4S05_11260 [Nostoc sp. KVJ20]|uniref:DinB/UmuC family translesion DNA polymerase n=1 Tax=Nostoc sp. KVJ20 TaxID=457944 RepID=UPI00083DD92E|nr:hypothetical protein [Nostoc sp. KVJ20]ODG97964.1 hypothetical protein A4S05_11260 [Nostoc sp. KVJ20]